MSQSPLEDAIQSGESPELNRYQNGWNKLNQLLRNGGSLSGRERNCCYLNLGSKTAKRFADISYVSGFDSSNDGRGMALVDWDRDGDIDIWMSNRNGPRVQFLRNKPHSRRRFVSLRLQGTTSNRDAIGARVEIEVEPSIGVVSRTVAAGDAYLSQSSKWLHFGLGTAQKIKSVRVRWPGTVDFVAVEGVSLDNEFVIVEGNGSAIRREVAAQSSDASTPSEAQQNGEADKMIVVGRLPLPRIDLQFAGEDPKPLPIGRPTFLLLWSPECPTCIEELTNWAENSDQLATTELDVIAVSSGANADLLNRAAKTIEETQFPFSWATIQPTQLQLIEAYLSFLRNDYQRPLSVPTGLLLDPFSQAAIVYRGPVKVDSVVNDQHILDQSPEELRLAGIPFRGKWLRAFVRPDPAAFATELSERFDSTAANKYFQNMIQIAEQTASETHPYRISSRWKGQALRALGTIKLAEGSFLEAANLSNQAQSLLPKDFRPLANQGAALLKLGRFQEALSALNKALELQPDRPSVLVNRATVHRQLGMHRKAIRDWETLLEINPDDERSRLSVAALAFALGDDQRAAAHYASHLRRNPNSIDSAGALAWILATSQNAAVRDGKRAVELATRWTNQTNGQNYKAFNALAAALAETGEYEKATDAIDRAIVLAQQSGDVRAAQAFQARRKVFQNKKPFRRGR